MRERIRSVLKQQKAVDGVAEPERLSRRRLRGGHRDEPGARHAVDHPTITIHAALRQVDADGDRGFAPETAATRHHLGNPWSRAQMRTIRRSRRGQIDQPFAHA